jgi:leucyl-tRNA synthetase
MSKSKYNVVNPDDVITQYGADCFRMFEMFLGPIEQSKPWDDKGISGVSSFLRKFWRLFYSETAWKVTDEVPTEKELKVLHKTIKKISEDIEKMSFNTSVSQFMIAVNELQDMKCSKRAILEPLILCLAPFAPFTTEELWHALGYEDSVHHASFPKFESKYLVENEIEYPVSINGKTRASITLPNEISQEEAWARVSELETVQKWMDGKSYKKFVFVKGRIINIVV